AFSGNDVISRFESGIVPDITFLDIEMPDGDGLEVLKYIKDNKVKTFSVMVSAHGTFENVKNAMDSGADGFIVKPYSEKKVVEMIKKYRKNN
ncbi:MAG: response regulator, partial [Gammaproteobacteria bacterium]|nr:response regulator [Gammaproteobacteria bacterium]